MSPKGVEHVSQREVPHLSEQVHPSMSPKGVEHDLSYPGLFATALAVHPSMSPKGVEHNLEAQHAAELAASASINVAERR